MRTMYQLDAGEWDAAFGEAMKTLFAGNRIEITVTELDETDYLWVWKPTADDCWKPSITLRIATR